MEFSVAERAQRLLNLFREEIHDYRPTVQRYMMLARREKERGTSHKDLKKIGGIIRRAIKKRNLKKAEGAEFVARVIGEAEDHIVRSRFVRSRLRSCR